MVDPVVGDNRPIEIESQDKIKSDRRRNFRKKNFRPKKDNSETNGDVNVTTPDLQNQTDRRPRKFQRKPRAPRVAVEGEVPSDGGVVREKADYSDGVLRLKVSSNRPRTVYTRLVRLMLAGYDSAGNTLELSQPITRVEVSALGNAIGPAIFVADNLIKGGVVTQKSVTADFVFVDGDQVSSTVAENKFKGSPRLVLSLEKIEAWNPMTDEVLNKTRVFRSKVLGLPEEEEDEGVAAANATTSA